MTGQEEAAGAGGGAGIPPLIPADPKRSPRPPPLPREQSPAAQTAEKRVTSPVPTPGEPCGAPAVPPRPSPKGEGRRKPGPGRAGRHGALRQHLPSTVLSLTVPRPPSRRQAPGRPRRLATAPRGRGSSYLPHRSGASGGDTNLPPSIVGAVHVCPAPPLPTGERPSRDAGAEAPLAGRAARGGAGASPWRHGGAPAALRGPGPPVRPRG